MQRTPSGSSVVVVVKRKERVVGRDRNRACRHHSAFVNRSPIVLRSSQIRQPFLLHRSKINFKHGRNHGARKKLASPHHDTSDFCRTLCRSYDAFSLRCKKSCEHPKCSLRRRVDPRHNGSTNSIDIFWERVKTKQMPITVGIHSHD
jgi:hypothetical protein